MAKNGSPENGGGENVGSLIEIKGVVVDAVFPNRLPSIYSALRITRPEGGELIAEVQQHLGDDRVRAVAMDSTDGIARGTAVVDTEAPIWVPVGEETLGRVCNVLGEPIDGREARPAGPERWPIHRDPPALDELSPRRGLRDRERGRELAHSVRPRWQDRPLRRRWAGQDGDSHRADCSNRQGPQRLLSLRGGRRANP